MALIARRGSVLPAARSFVYTIKLGKNRAESEIDCDSKVSVEQIKSTLLISATIVNSSILEAKERTVAIKTVGK